MTAAIAPARAVGDRSALARVVRNLVDNAARHAAGRVHLACGADDGTAWIEVTDDGPGVPQADRARVFERFVRLDDARAREDGGSGLGLAIVRELVRASGGTVRLDDAGPLPGARTCGWSCPLSRRRARTGSRLRGRCGCSLPPERARRSCGAGS